MKLLTALALVLALPAFAGATPIAGRIAASNDGNAVDCDSISSAAVEIALIAASGNAAKLVWYGYSDIPWGTSGQCGSGGNRDAEMRTSVVGTAALWGGFDSSAFHSVVSNQAAAVNALKDAINASSASNPLYITEGGPCDTIGKAVNAAMPSKLQYVYVITHSEWNDTTSHNGSWTRSSIAKAHPNLHWIKIPDQNAKLKSPKGDYSAWRDSKVAAVRRLWDRQAASGQSQFDISDSGMTYYLVTGRTVRQPTPQQVIALVGKGPGSSPPPPGPPPGPPPTTPPGPGVPPPQIDCPAQPRSGCTTADRGELKIWRKGSVRNRLVWKWLAGDVMTLPELGDPRQTTPYSVCLYDGRNRTYSPVLQMAFPVGDQWTVNRRGAYKYRDPQSASYGLRRALLRAGARGSSKILVVAGGADLPDAATVEPARMLSVAPDVVVQIANDRACWESGLPAKMTKVNTDRVFKSKLR